MIKYLILSLVIIVMITIDIILIQEFLFQHKNDIKSPKTIYKTENGLQEEPKIKEDIQKSIKENISDIEKEEIKDYIETKVSKTFENHIKEDFLTEGNTESNIQNTDNINMQEKIIKKDIKPLKAVSKVWLNLRKEPRLDSEVITVINTGDNVVIIDKKFKHWKKVIYKKGNTKYIGWVDDRYLDILEPIKESVASDSETPQDL